VTARSAKCVDAPGPDDLTGAICRSPAAGTE
jgi:hypothetical protein